MNYLLDTSTLIWAVMGPRSLSVTASSIINDDANTILVSAASAWEIATKVRLGKLPEAVVFERHFSSTVSDAGYIAIPIEVEIALRAGRLVGDHRDPFDRMLAAQALADDIPILSNDAKLDVFGARRIW